MTLKSKIVPAGGFHAPVLAALVAEIPEEDSQGLMAWNEPSLASLLSHPGNLSYITVVADMPVGFLLSRIAADEIEILALAVRPKWRRQGLANQMLERLITQARDTGVHKIYLEVSEVNESAQELYGKRGFAQVGRRAGYYQRRNGPAVDARILVRILE